MKTIEEKAKAYDEALERAKELLLGNEHSNTIRSYFEHIFPGLRESEDERIRKGIIHYLDYTAGGLSSEEQHKWIAWLEKQKEIPMPNSTELIEMWHKEKAMLKEKDFRGDEWRLAYNAFMGGFARGTCVKFEKQKEQKPNKDTGFPSVTKFVYNKSDEEFIRDCANILKGNDYGASAERLLSMLEQKPSYGIYWHAIKKGERLPCRAYIWDHNFEKYYDFWEGRLIPNMENISIGRDTWYLPADDVRDLPREGVDELLKGHNSAWSEEDEQWLESIIREYKERLSVDKDHAAVIQIKINFLKSLRPQPKQEWSEKDNIGWDEAFACVTRAEKDAKNEEELQNAVTAEKWLKEIKFKYYVHPVKQEWSEEDEAMRDNILRCLQCFVGNAECESNPSLSTSYPLYRREMDWLKSLRPHWKPSEEQMRALGDYIDGEEISEYDMEEIVRLYNDLQTKL